MPCASTTSSIPHSPTTSIRCRTERPSGGATNSPSPGHARTRSRPTRPSSPVTAQVAGRLYMTYISRGMPRGTPLAIPPSPLTHQASGQILDGAGQLPIVQRGPRKYSRRPLRSEFTSPVRWAECRVDRRCRACRQRRSGPGCGRSARRDQKGVVLRLDLNRWRREVEMTWSSRLQRVEEPVPQGSRSSSKSTK